VPRPAAPPGAAAVTQRPADHACTAAGCRGFAGPVGPDGSGTPDPYRDGGGQRVRVGDRRATVGNRLHAR